MLNFSYPIFPKHSKSQNLLFVAWPLSQGRSECPICSFPAGLAMTSLMVPRFRSCKYANAFWFRASGSTPWFGLWISRKCAHPRKCDGDRPAPDPGSFGAKIAQRKALHLEPHDELSLPDPLALLKKKYPFGNPWNHLKKITRNMPSKIRRTIKKKSRLPIVTKSLRFLVGWGRLGSVALRMTCFSSPGKNLEKKQPIRFFEASGISCHCLKGKVLLGLFIKSPELFIKSYGTIFKNIWNIPSRICRTIRKISRLSNSLRFLVGWGRIRAFPLLMKNFPSPLDFLCNGRRTVFFFTTLEQKYCTVSRTIGNKHIPARVLPMKNSMSPIGVCDLRKTNRR